MRFRLLLPALLGALLAAACGAGNEEIVARNLTLQFTPSASQTLRYKVTQENDVTGACDLNVAKKGPDLALTQSCEGGGFKDNVTVLADPGSFHPKSVERTIEGSAGSVTCGATYGDGTLTVKWTSGDDERTSTLDVPAEAYDSWADLFLWGSLNLAAGVEERYTDVGSCTQQRSDPKLVGVRLDVKSREQIQVPAGQYDVWRVEVHSEGRTQTVWYSADDKHILVRYDNGSQVFELESGN